MTEERTDLWRWGDVPQDGDVRPFNQLAVVRSKTNRSNRRHHFLSVTYMNGFCNVEGRLWVYRHDKPEAPHLSQPSAIGYQNHYYSQKLPDGGIENVLYEDLWGLIETVWPETLRAIRARRLSPAISFNALGMASLARVRVPAARECHEVILARKLRAEAIALERIGHLPPEWAQYAGMLDIVPVGINPQETLRTMGQDFRAFGDLCFRLGFEIIHNKTSIPFVTSDNPVAYYDPRSRVEFRTPYGEQDPVELIFPLDVDTLLRGSTNLMPANVITHHREVADPSVIRAFNRTTAQFSYRFLLSQDRSVDKLAQRHARLVPTASVDVRQTEREIKIFWKQVFGPMPRLSSFIDTPEKAARLEAQMRSG